MVNGSRLFLQWKTSIFNIISHVKVVLSLLFLFSPFGYEVCDKGRDRKFVNAYNYDMENCASVVCDDWGYSVTMVTINMIMSIII